MDAGLARKSDRSPQLAFNRDHLCTPTNQLFSRSSKTVGHRMRSPQGREKDAHTTAIGKRLVLPEFMSP